MHTHLAPFHSTCTPLGEVYQVFDISVDMKGNPSDVYHEQ